MAQSSLNRVVETLETLSLQIFLEKNQLAEDTMRGIEEGRRTMTVSIYSLHLFMSFFQ